MKINYNDMRKEIASIIKTATSVNSYYLNRPATAYPYIVFDLKEVACIDGQTTYNLEVDVFTKDIKTTNDHADSIEQAFDHYIGGDSKFFFHSYRARRYDVVEEDKTVKRVHIQMELYVYSKEE